MRKTLSLVVLKRISKHVNTGTFLSACQSGFRQGRSTTDIVWSHRWLAAKSQRYHWIYSILGIDMSRAFDTIKRSRLLQVLSEFLQEDEVKIIRYLIADTKLSVRMGKEISHEFPTTLGATQL